MLYDSGTASHDLPAEQALESFRQLGQQIFFFFGIMMVPRNFPSIPVDLSSRGNAVRLLINT